LYSISHFFILFFQGLTRSVQSSNEIAALTATTERISPPKEQVKQPPAPVSQPKPPTSVVKESILSVQFCKK